MIAVGITGQAGFVGTCLYNTLGLYPEKYKRVPFKDEFFKSADAMEKFVGQCDVIVHLAAVNRCPDPKVLYETNIALVKQLIDAMCAVHHNPYILFSSSTQEEKENEYGRSKREGRALLEKWAKENGASFTGMIVPNVYGPFGRPNYNSFIATFAYRLTHAEEPEVLQDSDVRLIYVGSLVSHILSKIDDYESRGIPYIDEDHVPFDFDRKVTDILGLFKVFKSEYFDKGIIPDLKDRNDVNLFNTFRSYIDCDAYFPRMLVKHSDDRGSFIETVKLKIGGQVSFSTTVPEVVRGNHFHIRKIERFTVLKGKALVQLRKIGTDKVLNFEMDGNSPSYIDMPIWYTHNLRNIGTEDLYMQFWINEIFDDRDPDTFAERV